MITASKHEGRKLIHRNYLVLLLGVLLQDLVRTTTILQLEYET